ncbi:unnamed protein product [Angiostrongylus costaricensis]|uniref:Ras-GEF domain-containing protein n=1 Tax=Angiostrongylus costaricensis TaxID=334426 RepID=A0A0R3PHB2_ANGCS|nr:unnamed protein product [Angiostrongylus costaricensis]
MESALLCVSRYHSFMEVRCSTFLNEAGRLKKELDPSVTPTREICRFLHLNSLCLENTIAMYCTNAKKIFRRLNFRDYFPSFILPANDTLFDDLDLDNCQMYDFVKKNTRKIEDHYLDKVSPVSAALTWHMLSVFTKLCSCMRAWVYFHLYGLHSTITKTSTVSSLVVTSNKEFPVRWTRKLPVSILNPYVHNSTSYTQVSNAKHCKINGPHFPHPERVPIR